MEFSLPRRKLHSQRVRDLCASVVILTPEFRFAMRDTYRPAACFLPTKANALSWA